MSKSMRTILLKSLSDEARRAAVIVIAAASGSCRIELDSLSEGRILPFLQQIRVLLEFCLTHLLFGEHGLVGGDVFFRQFWRKAWP